jgi:hypothetical protein
MNAQRSPQRAHAADEGAGLFKPVAMPAVKAAVSIKGRSNFVPSRGPDKVTSDANKLSNKRSSGPTARQGRHKPRVQKAK